MTKSLAVSIPHQLGRTEAKRRLVTGIEGIKDRYRGKFSILEEQWTGDRLDFRVGLMGQTIGGSVDIGEDQVILAVGLPWILAVLADKAKTLIQRQGQLMLERK